MRMWFLLKFCGTDSMKYFRPIVVRNFRFKIISKIRTHRLALKELSVSHWNGFIKERHVKYYICITFEVINMLSRKAKGGIVSFKIDIKKKPLILLIKIFFYLCATILFSSNIQS